VLVCVAGRHGDPRQLVPGNDEKQCRGDCREQSELEACLPQDPTCLLQTFLPMHSEREHEKENENVERGDWQHASGQVVREGT